jgi:multiple sugar transport system ATP-binding protein
VFVASFVGSPAMNLIDGELRDGRVSALAGSLEVPLNGRAPKAAAPRAQVTIGIRSEDIRVGPNEAVAAKVHDVENHGVEKVVTLRAADQLIKATVPATTDVSIDTPVRFTFNPAKLHCFDRHSGLNMTGRESRA